MQFTQFWPTIYETNEFLMSVSWVGQWESWQHETVESGTGDCLESEFYIGVVGVYCGSILCFLGV